MIHVFKASTGHLLWRTQFYNCCLRAEPEKRGECLLCVWREKSDKLLKCLSIQLPCIFDALSLVCLHICQTAPPVSPAPPCCAITSKSNTDHQRLTIIYMLIACHLLAFRWITLDYWRKQSNPCTWSSLSGSPKVEVYCLKALFIDTTWRCFKRFTHTCYATWYHILFTAFSVDAGKC